MQSVCKYVIARAQRARGERTERCQWQRKRGERVAAVKISSVRRKAAQKFWAPQQGHPHPPSPGHGKAVTGGFFFPPHRQGTRALPYKALRYRAGRTGSSAPTNRSVGAGVPDGPLYRTPCNASVGADAHIGPPHRTPCKKSCHCEASANAGRGNSYFPF